MHLRPTIILLIIGQLSIAQSNEYFQQEVNYNIEVTLNDSLHQLDGFIEIEYTNNAPSELSEIWMHLWPNAYKNINTAFAKQQVRNGKTEFYFAKEEDFGYLDSLDFRVDGQKSTWDYDEEHIDIATITLNKPLKSGEQIIIRSPFMLKIPSSFSRLGHVGQSYQLTQWFPKPAVYDAKGWHPMPYLDIGEFYSEFGTFEVKITLPENYVVAATGVLQNQKEIDFLLAKAATTKKYVKNGFPDTLDFPFSAKKLKTLHYKADKVHDFAWFADKRFHVQKSEVTLASGRKIDTWTMFTNEDADLWSKSIEYVDRAVAFYSDKVGGYPWPQATGLQSALSAGGGMEYPMITVIGEVASAKDLDQVLTHEVGHNWFYGILASNERDYPWMDEGLNSYYEYRYMNENYNNRVVEDMAPLFFQKKTKVDLLEASYLFTARRHQNQAPATHSDDFSMINYGIESYIKTGSALQHLDAYLGRDFFDKAMQTYFNQWQFKHPYPEDLRTIFKEVSGKNLDWFFDDYIYSNKRLDYALTQVVSNKVTITNRGNMAAPIPVAALKDNQIVETQWYEEGVQDNTLTFMTTDVDEFMIDPNHLTLDLYRQNNNIKSNGLFKKSEPLKVKIIPTIENPQEKELFVLPAFGYNTYDKLMLGAVLYNRTLPSKKFEYAITPLYSFKTKDLNGTGDLAYHFYSHKNNSRLTLATNIKSFNQFRRDSIRTMEGFTGFNQKYLKIAPSLSYTFPSNPKEKKYKRLTYRALWINEQFSDFDMDGFFVGNEWEDRFINELTYEMGNKRVLNPYGLKLQVEQQEFLVFGQEENTVRATLELNTAYTYAHKRSIDFRFFAGGFLQNTFRERDVFLPNSLNLVGQGFNDYKYDELYFGRNEVDGFWSQQFALRDGGLKAPFGSPIKDGRSNNFVFAMNVIADLPQDLPFNLPAKPYFDLGYFKESRPSVFNGQDFDKASQLWWSFGVALEWGDVLGIYFPLVSSNVGFNNVDDLYKQKGNYWSRISFRINFQKLNPWKAVEELAQ